MLPNFVGSSGPDMIVLNTNVIQSRIVQGPLAIGIASFLPFHMTGLHAIPLNRGWAYREESLYHCEVLLQSV